MCDWHLLSIWHFLLRERGLINVKREGLKSWWSNIWCSKVPQEGIYGYHDLLMRWDFSWALACQWAEVGIAHWATGFAASCQCHLIVPPRLRTLNKIFITVKRDQERFIQNLPAGKKCIPLAAFSQMVKNCGRVDPIAQTTRSSRLRHSNGEKAAFIEIANDIQTNLALSQWDGKNQKL